MTNDQTQPPEYQQPLLNGNLMAQAWYLFLQALATKVNGGDPVQIAGGTPPSPQAGAAVIYLDSVTGVLGASLNGSGFYPLLAPFVGDITPTVGVPDLAKGTIQRLTLDGSAVTLRRPVVTNGAVYPGQFLLLLVDQDVVGSHPAPAFELGAFGSDAASQVISTTGRSGYLFFYDGAIWNLLLFRAGIATT